MLHSQEAQEFAGRGAGCTRLKPSTSDPTHAPRTTACLEPTLQALHSVVTPCCWLTPGSQELDAMFELVDAQARDGAADED